MNPALVKIDVAADLMRRSIPAIVGMVDGGSPSEAGLLWTFNLSRKLAGRRRELRFWRPELLERATGQAASCHKLELAQVIGQILPEHREHFHAGEVDQMFQTRPRTRLDFGAELPGKRVGGRHVYSRPVLVSFLQRRWIGIGGEK